MFVWVSIRVVTLRKQTQKQRSLVKKKTITEKSSVVQDKFNSYGFKNQLELFEHCWDNRLRKCYVTGEDLNKYNGTQFFLSIFAHILRKSAFPEFKLYVNNIVLISPRVHHLLDNGSLDQILKFEAQTVHSFRIIFELEQDIFNEYSSNFGYKTPKRKLVENYLKREI